MTLPQDHIGVDVSKGWIDAHHLSTGRHRRIEATRRAAPDDVARALLGFDGVAPAYGDHRGDHRHTHRRLRRFDSPQGGRNVAPPCGPEASSRGME
jgi:hypothetical protein